MTEQQVVDRRVSSHRTAVSHRMLYDRWINELWAGRRNAEDLVCADFVGHWPRRDIHGAGELQAVVDNTRRSLEELLFVIDVSPFIQGDMVAARWIATGSGRSGPVRLTGNDILRVMDGKVIEYWSSTARG